jgi:hypothetical protein
LHKAASTALEEGRRLIYSYPKALFEVLGPPQVVVQKGNIPHSLKLLHNKKAAKGSLAVSQNNENKFKIPPSASLN